MSYESDERFATQKGRYIAKTTELRKNEGTAIAWSELGYSNGGIAKKMDTSEGTVSSWKGRAMALYGLEIAHALLPEEERREFEQVTPSYIDDLEPRERRVAWLEKVLRHEDKLPQEWVANVKERAMEVDERAMKTARE